MIAALSLLVASCRSETADPGTDAGADAAPDRKVDEQGPTTGPDVVFSVDLVGTSERHDAPAGLVRLKQDAPYPYRKLSIKPETRLYWVQSNDCPPGMFETWYEMEDVWTDDAGGFVAVGSNGRIVMRRGGRWSCWIGDRAIWRVTGSSWGNVHVMQKSGLLHFNARKWTRTEDLPGSLTDIWAGKGVVWAVTRNGHIVRLDRETVTTWKLSTGVALDSVWGSSPDDVWVAAGSMLLGYDGEVWTWRDAGLEGLITQIAGAPGKDPWIRTSQGEVARLDGSSFRTIDPPGEITAFHVTPEGIAYAGVGMELWRWTGKEWRKEDERIDSIKAIHGSRKNGLAVLEDFELDYGKWEFEGFSGHTIWGSAEDDIWAVGSKGMIQHFDGKRWSSVESPTEEHLRDVHGVDASCAWIAGDGVVLRWNGKRWIVRPVPDERDLDALHVLSCEHFFAVGPSDVVLEYEGGKWREHVLGMPIYLRGVWGLSPTDVWVVGDQGAILHWDGVSWTPEASGAGDTLHDVMGLPTGEVWAVGDEESSDGLFMRTESGWRKLADASGQSLFVLDPTHVYVSSYWWELSWSGADIWMWNGKKVVQTSVMASEPCEEDGPYLASVWGVSPSRLWAAGDGLYRLFRSSDAPKQDAWEGSESTVLDCELEKPPVGEWRIERPTNWNLHAAWGDSPSSLWAVGDGGTILHFDGKTWSRQDSGTMQRLDVVWGFGPADVWAAGAQGTILHDDGNGWKAAASPTKEPITAAAAPSSDDVWIGTDAGGIFHHDGDGWTEVADVDKPVLALHASSGRPLWIATQHRVLTWDGNEVSEVDLEHEYGDPWIQGVAGGGKHVWLADGQDVWSMGKGKRRLLGGVEYAVENANVTALAGTSPKNVWFAATPGAGCILNLMASSLCRFDGKRWACYWCDDLPLLQDVHPFPSGHVVAVGMEGIVVRTE